MMRIVYLFLILSLPAYALEYSHTSGKANHKYMQLILSEYIPWLKQELKLNFSDIGKDEAQFIQKNLNLIDHWVASDYKMMEKFLFGLNANKNDSDLYFRIYIDKSLRNDTILKKFKKNGETLFLEWDNTNGVCYITKANNTTIRTFNLPFSKDGIYFTHTCKNGSIFVTRYLEKKLERLLKDGAISNYGEFITYNKEGKVIKTMIKDSPQYPLINPDLITPFINKHMIKTMISINKYSIDINNKIMIYVP